MELIKSMQARKQFMEDSGLRLEWEHIDSIFYYLKIWKKNLVIAMTSGMPDQCVEAMYYECRRKGYLK